MLEGRGRCTQEDAAGVERCSVRPRKGVASSQVNCSRESSGNCFQRLAARVAGVVLSGNSAGTVKNELVCVI